MVSSHDDLTPGAQRVFDAMRQLGLSESMAFSAAVGRDGGSALADPFDRTAAAFERMGLSESAARVAATGRDATEPQVRESMRSADAARAFRDLSETHVERLRARAARFRERAPSLPWRDALVNARAVDHLAEGRTDEAAMASAESEVAAVESSPAGAPARVVELVEGAGS